MSANFTPTQTAIADLRPFRMWCQKVLPAIYDESLSYYELLNKVVNYINQNIEDINTLNSNVTNIYNAYVLLQNYVNDYFENEAPQVVADRINAMAEDGTLTNLISGYVDPLFEAKSEEIDSTINARVDLWLDNHPEATTTVEDGAISSVKLANDAVTTDKITDHAVTMDKTDFYYKTSISKTYSWLSMYFQTNYRVSFKWSEMETVLQQFPENLSLVYKGVSQYWATSGQTLQIATSGGHTADVARTSATLTVNGIKYGILKFTRESFETAYNALKDYVEVDGETWTNKSFQVNNTGTGKIPANAETWIIDDVVTTDMIEAGFMVDVMSEDFATAVTRVIESGGGTSTDEETARNRLSGKVMICLGDSYTVGMGGLLTTLANKYEMKLDNRGVVSSSICGTWSASTGTGTGYQPMWRRANTIVSDYTEGYVIGETTYQKTDVGVVVFMGGANDGFGIDTWIGRGINDTDTSRIYGACNSIFNALAKTFTNAKLVCITQPSSYNRDTSTIPDDATAQALGFDNLAQLQAMDNIQFSNFAMAQKEKAVYNTAWAYGWNIIDMFHDFPTMFNPTNRSTYWQSDKLHLTSAGYSLITEALDKKIVELVVG